MRRERGPTPCILLVCILTGWYSNLDCPACIACQVAVGTDIIPCRLSEDQYLNNIGRKQAPHFGADSRRIIYQVFAAYEAVSVWHCVWCFQCMYPVAGHVWHVLLALLLQCLLRLVCV